MAVNLLIELESVIKDQTRWIPACQVKASQPPRACMTLLDNPDLALWIQKPLLVYQL
jgi:hypothetical protein